MGRGSHGEGCAGQQGMGRGRGKDTGQGKEGQAGAGGTWGGGSLMRAPLMAVALEEFSAASLTTPCSQLQQPRGQS